MIKTSNFICSIILRQFALFILKISPAFRIKYLSIKLEITQINQQKKYIPENLINSVLIIEDKRYFQHYGIDVYAIFRSTYKNIITKNLQGASTIEQQLVRSITNERQIKIVRKIKELMHSLLINKEFSKHEIIHAYLEACRFGNCKGITELCKKENYNIINLSNIDSAQIAARFKYPSINQKNYIRYLKRVRKIEKLLSEKNNF